MSNPHNPEFSYSAYTPSSSFVPPEVNPSSTPSQTSLLSDFLPSTITASNIASITSSIVSGVRKITASATLVPPAPAENLPLIEERRVSYTNLYDPETVPEAGTYYTDSERDSAEDNTAMPTRFPREIKVKELKEYDGTPADLDSFDNSVKQCLLSQNLPLYYGGYVLGDLDSEYNYVASPTVDAKSNYIIGKRLCAALTSKLTGNAKKWWEDYDSKPDNPTPNCWRKHADMRNPVANCTGGTVGTSMFELLKTQFSGEVDARTAEIELGKYK